MCELIKAVPVCVCVCLHELLMCLGFVHLAMHLNHLPDTKPIAHCDANINECPTEWPMNALIRRILNLPQFIM